MASADAVILAPVADDVLAERVRARLGHNVSHASIEVQVAQGEVTLRGPVLDAEVDGLLRAVRAVPGVRGVALTRADTPLGRSLRHKLGTALYMKGDAAAALAQADKVIETEYHLPYLAHTPIEPLNCVVKVDKTACELWYACQMQTNDQHEVAKATGLKPEQVRIHTLYAGGSFGRRASRSSGAS